MIVFYFQSSGESALMYPVLIWKGVIQANWLNSIVDSVISEVIYVAQPNPARLLSFCLSSQLARELFEYSRPSFSRQEAFNLNTYWLKNLQ